MCNCGLPTCLSCGKKNFTDFYKKEMLYSKAPVLTWDNKAAEKEYTITSSKYKPLDEMASIIVINDYYDNAEAYTEFINWTKTHNVKNRYYTWEIFNLSTKTGYQNPYAEYKKTYPKKPDGMSFPALGIDAYNACVNLNSSPCNNCLQNSGLATAEPSPADLYGGAVPTPAYPGESPGWKNKYFELNNSYHELKMKLQSIVAKNLLLQEELEVEKNKVPPKKKTTKTKVVLQAGEQVLLTASEECSIQVPANAGRVLVRSKKKD